MIVGHMFPDDDLDVAWRQHDVYKHALEIIFLRTNRYTTMARQILNDTKHEGWGAILSVDHRTLQSAHDFLAAAWRWSYLRPSFDFEGRSEQTLEDSWLSWLALEIEGWVEAPQLIRLVQITLCNQNEEIGYAAEATLSAALLERFDQVEWHEEQREAYRADLARYPFDILDDATVPSSKPLGSYNTYRFPTLRENLR